MLHTLNEHYLGQGKQYLYGDRLTIADYFGPARMTAGEIIGIDFSDYPNLENWVKSITSVPSWSAVKEIHNGLATTLKGKSFMPLA